MWWFWLAGSALAGGVFLNGTPVDARSLQGVVFEKVNVKVDPMGNVYIDAPGYKIEVAPGVPGGMPGVVPGYPGAPLGNPAFAPTGTAGYPAPTFPGGAPDYPAVPGGMPGAAPMTGYPASVPVAPPNAYGAPGAYATAPPISAGPPQPYPNGIARGRWWLVTDDKASQGHTVEVHVNGQLVQTVKSGEAQRIIDVGMFIRPGPNNVECKAFSTQDNNGTLYLYLGSGADQSGTVRMDPPQVQFGVGTNTTFMNTRTFTLNVQ
jgi:hypothetical protein